MNYQQGNYKVVVAHPGKQHSYQLATALEKKGMLHAYLTTVYDKKGSITHFLIKLLKGKEKNKANSRCCKDIPDEKVIQYGEFGGLILLMLLRLPKFLKKYRLEFKWCMKVNSYFSKRAAWYALDHNIDALILFDTAAEQGFEILLKEKSNIVRIMDVSIATRQYMKFNFLKDEGIEGLKIEFPELWNDKIMQSYQNEIDFSQNFIVASSMTSQSLQFCGVNSDLISIVPYGVDLEKFSFSPKADTSGALKIIYVGQISYRKGIHHLLSIVEKFSKKEVEVCLIGQYNSNSEIYKKYKDVKNINFCGFLTGDKLANFYHEADVFVFPTIGEGYGLVVLESLSCGVPVITSNLAGGNDAIKNGKNGFVFTAGDCNELETKIRWCLSHRKELANMREYCYKSANNYTWERYYENVTHNIKLIISKQRNV